VRNVNVKAIFISNFITKKVYHANTGAFNNSLGSIQETSFCLKKHVGHA